MGNISITDNSETLWQAVHGGSLLTPILIAVILSFIVTTQDDKLTNFEKVMVPAKYWIICYMGFCAATFVWGSFR